TRRRRQPRASDRQARRRQEGRTSGNRAPWAAARRSPDSAPSARACCAAGEAPSGRAPSPAPSPRRAGQVRPLPEMTELRYRSFVEVDDLVVDECTVKTCLAEDGKRFWHMWARVLRA